MPRRIGHRPPSPADGPRRNTHVPNRSNPARVTPSETFVPGAATPAAPAAGPTPLGTFDGLNLVVAPDGRIGFGVPPATLSEEIKALRHAVVNAVGGQPLSSIQDVATLRSVAQASARLFDACLRRPVNEGEAIQLRQGRAGALAMMEAAARRAGALGDEDARDALTLGLFQSLAREPYRPLRAFMYESALTHAEKGELANVRTAEKVLYPDKPPYARWLKDGKIKIVAYTDDDGCPRADHLNFFRELGFKQTDNPDGTSTLRLRARGDEPEIEVVVAPAPTRERPPALFEHINTPDVDVIAYSGHAGYGRRVEHALSNGVGGTGEDKLVILMQCYGEGSIESLRRAYPDAKLISSRSPTDGNLDDTLFESILANFRAKRGWREMRKDTIDSFHEWQRVSPDYADTQIESLYFYPDDRTVLLAKTDRDKDGVRDDGDHVFNVVFPKRVDAAGGYEPLDPGAPLDCLDGSALGRATTSLSLVARYAALPPEVTRGVPWNPEVFTPDGFFEPEPGDRRSFRFHADGEAGRIRVQLSSRFAHTPEIALTRMLAYEAGLWVGEKAGLDDAGRLALGLSLLERALHQGGEPTGEDYLDLPATQEQFFRTRYGLPLSFDDLTAATGNPDDFKPAHYQALVERVRARPELLAAARAAPGPAVEPLSLPEGLRLIGSIDRESSQRLIERLGFVANLPEYFSLWISSNYATRKILPAQGPDGKTYDLVLAIDSEGYVQAGAKIERPA